jgi:hypothetical protein
MSDAYYPKELVYTVSAARRILGEFLAPIQVVKFWRSVWVWVKGRRPRFMSKAAFKNEFVRFRSFAAKTISVTKNLFDSSKFSVRSQSRDRLYELEATNNSITCTCRDFRDQIDAFGRGVCKHGYAVLGVLGFSNLRDYIDSKG